MATTNLLRGGFRIGIVSSTNPKKGTIKVRLEELTGPDDQPLITGDLYVVFSNTRKNRDYALPDLDEQVVCLFLGNGIEFGVVLGAIYSDVDPPPVDCQDKRHTQFADGTVLEYDRATHVLKADVKGDITLSATGNITIQAGGSVDIDGQRIELN